MASSRALPLYFYRDPAEVIERLDLDRKGCSVCASFKLVLGRGLCTDARNDKQRGVPRIGHKCRWFSERG